APEEIRRQILTGCPNAIEIGNRREAIIRAMSLIQPGDFVVIAGKGHEDYQIYGNEITHFSDREEISETQVKMMV
ncbi:MAG: UDP-N-acetylmuramoyl-L-alanyl-D-glutamate--2,6-diaminopimelate ligase, partial [Alphaproteobacteria bacterium]|nr:UDP-N-acetylmuramoyl-L-alanyl-D-glutamate--2,6-diaminopimelate ligase [Alphaproteobacteria bacterium]